MEKLMELFVLMLSGYFFCGLLFAILFVWKGVTAIDPDGAKGTRLGFRLIIIPGTMAFWPVLLKKWISASVKKND